MPTGKWLVFDTGVYIAAIRGGLEGPTYQILQQSLPRTYLASVVSAELRAGATTETARRAVQDFTRSASRVGRVVTPSASAWDRAGDLLGHIRRRELHLRDKVQRLWNDVLIALSARQIGATVVTENARDFDLLRRYLRFDLEPLAPSGSGRSRR
jgi:predicted nucleic acid-binding protein